MMTTILLFKGIRDDQSVERQRMAGRFYTDTRSDAGHFGSIVETNEIEFLSLYEALNPVYLAREWGVDESLVTTFLTIRSALIEARTASEHYQWPAYHACSYILDVQLAREARQRGYDGIHYRGWGIYVKL